MIYLTLDELLLVAERAIGQHVLIGDAGLLESALARPQTVLFGEDANPDIHTKLLPCSTRLVQTRRWWMAIGDWHLQVR